jgi:tetratricopeptide (TPR) repeat protein
VGDLLWAFEAQNNLAWAYTRLGERAEADAAVTHAIDLADRSGSPTAKVDVKSTIAIHLQEREEFDEALRMAREAPAEGEEKRILTCAAFGHLTAGEILLRRGETAEAERSLNRATRLARVSQAAFIENLGRAGLNAARWAAGRHDEASAGWAEGLERAQETADPFAKADVLWRRGAALAGDDATREAGITDLEDAARGFAELNAKPARTRVLGDLIVAYRDAGRDEDAARTTDEMRRLRRDLGLPQAVPAL